MIAVHRLDYWDVDFYNVPVSVPPELDVVGFGDNSHAVDVLMGSNGQDMSASWDVFCQIQCNSSGNTLRFQINIDAAHEDYFWCLGLYQANLITEFHDDIGTAVPMCGCEQRQTK